MMRQRTSEVGHILGTMQACWPGFAEDDVAADLWLGYISRVPTDVGRRAAQRLIESSEYKPSVAGWQEACRIEVRRVEAEQPALEMPHVRDPNGKERIEGIRDLLASKPAPAALDVPRGVVLDVSHHKRGEPATYEQLTARPGWEAYCPGDVLPPV